MLFRSHGPQPRCDPARADRSWKAQRVGGHASSLGRLGSFLRGDSLARGAPPQKDRPSGDFCVRPPWLESRSPRQLAKCGLFNGLLTQLGAGSHRDDSARAQTGTGRPITLSRKDLSYLFGRLVAWRHWATGQKPNSNDQQSDRYNPPQHFAVRIKHVKTRSSVTRRDDVHCLLFQNMHMHKQHIHDDGQATA